MTRLHVTICVLLLAGCRDRVQHTEPGVARSGSAVTPSALDIWYTIETVYQARGARIREIGSSCAPGDWPVLVLMAAGIYDWRDDLAAREPRAVPSIQCQAEGALRRIDHLLTGAKSSKTVLRRVAAAFTRPDILATLDGAISGAIPLSCPTRDDFASLVEFAPLHQLRPTIEMHASERIREGLLATLDSDLGYHAGPRAVQLERWAADLTPAGFIRVVEALAPGYTWNDGAAPPSAAEQAEIEMHAAALIEWLFDTVTMSKPDFVCQPPLVDALASGDLGKQLLARLDHPNPKIRAAILWVFSSVPPPESRARIVEQRSDPDPAVRTAAWFALEWVDRGGKTKVITEEYEARTRASSDGTLP
jgi:hypothetical protein